MPLRPSIFVTAVIACALAAASRAHAEPSLRRRWPLLPRLVAEATAPPITHPEAVVACVPSTYPNPWSTLPSPLRALDQRLTLATFPGGRFELRDALLVPTPRTLTFELAEAPPDARLELEYHLYPCRGGSGAPGQVSVRVAIDDALGHAELTVPLPRSPSPPAGDTSRWSSLQAELPLVAGTPARVTLTFASSAKDTPVVALSEPVVSGRPDRDADPSDTNVLWIVIDSARADALGPARSIASVTPALDRLFDGGTAFSHAWSMSNQTRTSTTAMLGSVHPSIAGYQSHDWAFAKHRLRDFYRGHPPFLTRTLADAGWRVAHIGDNNFLWASNRSGVDVDFPAVDDYRVDEQDARLATAAATRFATEHQDERWFLMLEYLAPHTPYLPPAAWQDAADALPGEGHLGPEHHLPRGYLGELMWVDKNVGDLLASLDALDLTQRTLIIVTADHGEVMLPWHDCSSWRVKLRCGYNHSVTVYDDELHVPLTLHLPGRIAAGRVIDTPVSHADLVPTVLAVLALPPRPGVVGRSILDALEGGPLTPGPLYADGRLASALRDGDWKLIVHAPDDDAATRARTTPKAGDLAPDELFDLARDPDERKNLAEEKPDVVVMLRARMEAVRAELARRYAPAAAPP